MPRMGEMSVIAKDVMSITFLVDRSGNDKDSDSEFENAFDDLLIELHKVEEEFNVSFYISYIKYSTDAQIIANSENLDDFYMRSVPSGGLSDLGRGLKLIPKVLSGFTDKIRNNLVRYCYNPILIFIARNYPTDDFQKELSLLKPNKQYSLSKKVAFNYGGDFDATGVYAEVTENEESSNIPLSYFCETIKRMIESEVAKHKYDDGPAYQNSSFLRVDPIETTGNFDAIINVGGVHTYFEKVNIEKTITFSRCQMTPCDPNHANDIVLCITDLGDFVSVENTGLDCYVDIYIAAQSEKVIKNCFDKKIKLIFISDDSNSSVSDMNVDVQINSKDSTIIITNNESLGCTARVNFLMGESMELTDGDKVVTAYGDNFIEIKRSVFEDLPDSTGGLISGGDIPEDIWD